MRPLLSRFSPQLLPLPHLERRMVGREHIARTLVDGVVETVQHGGARYELILAPRGLGKTHLLTVVAGRLRDHPMIAARAVMVVLDEEEHLSGLLDLFRRVLGRMPPEPGLPDAKGLAAGIGLPSSGDGIDPVVAMITGRLGDRPLVLVVENFDRLLAALSAKERWRFRGVLEGQARITVIATAQAVSAALTDKREAFFHKFHRTVLDPLSAEQCGRLLTDLALDSGKFDLVEALGTPEGRGQVRAIHHLLGGTPRAMALLFPYLTVDTLHSLEEAFYPLGDELTPYIQEQWRNRAPGEQAVLEALAQRWRPLTVTEISNQTLSKPSSVSTQLKRLSADQFVQVVSVGKERFYSIGDPLARLRRAMKSQEEAPRVFVRFLRHWHTRQELSVHSEKELDPLRRALWQSALRWQPDEASAFAACMDDEVNQLLEAGEHTAAVEAADRAWLAEPCVETTLSLLQALAAVGDWERYADVVETAMGRFDPVAITLGVAARPPQMWRPLLPRCRAQLRSALEPVLVENWTKMDGQSVAKFVLMSGLAPGGKVDEWIARWVEGPDGVSWHTIELLILRDVLEIEGRRDLCGRIDETLFASSRTDRYFTKIMVGVDGVLAFCLRNRLGLLDLLECMSVWCDGFCGAKDGERQGGRARELKRSLFESSENLCIGLPGLQEAFRQILGQFRFAEAQGLWNTNREHGALVVASVIHSSSFPERHDLDLPNLLFLLFVPTLELWAVLNAPHLSLFLREAIHELLDSHTALSTVVGPEDAGTSVWLFVLVRIVHDAASGAEAVRRADSLLTRILAKEPRMAALSLLLARAWLADPDYLPHGEAVLRARAKLGPEKAESALLTALLAVVDGNFRPWARLSLPERDVVVSLLHDSGPRGQVLAQGLPPVE